MTVPTFSRIEAGYEFPPVNQSYVQPAIDYYALASLDMNPVHTNEEWASRAKVFGIPETVGHGMKTVTATGKVKRKHHHGLGKNWVQIAIEAKDSTGDLIGLAEVGYNLPD